ncbi:hypothetical protein LshimejAT787_0212010 [Lyophyllum shimeji]|uniref:DUF7702 domain-containing protein n=1 Tax=Lyophyllum shimeji TaxID=47721 RepID=A0A9P3ULR2_LYOSH|nr:hypothetical protein LshimejAT787_0212010 [Lyophyllum shimeji]
MFLKPTCLGHVSTHERSRGKPEDNQHPLSFAHLDNCHCPSKRAFYAITVPSPVYPPLLASCQTCAETNTAHDDCRVVNDARKNKPRGTNVIGNRPWRAGSWTPQSSVGFALFLLSRYDNLFKHLGIRVSQECYTDAVQGVMISALKAASHHLANTETALTTHLAFRTVNWRIVLSIEISAPRGPFHLVYSTLNELRPCGLQVVSGISRSTDATFTDQYQSMRTRRSLQQHLGQFCARRVIRSESAAVKLCNLFLAYKHSQRAAGFLHLFSFCGNSPNEIDMSSHAINYAKAFGIESVAAAIVFTIAYVPLFGWFVRQSFGRPTYVFFVLSFFCVVRMTAFIIRAVLAGSDTAGQNLGLLIGDEVLFGVGFFGLLYSAYTLVLDRRLLTNVPPGTDPLSQLTQNRRIFRLALTVAVALGIVGSTQAQSSDPHKGNTLRIVSTVIFLVLTVLLVYQTVLLARIELHLTSGGYSTPAHQSFGHGYGAYVLCVIALLLLVRETFTTATVSNYAKQYNEHFWYPLYALPEIVAVVLYATPGLVPPRSELPT